MKVYCVQYDFVLNAKYAFDIFRVMLLRIFLLIFRT